MDFYFGEMSGRQIFSNIFKSVRKCNVLVKISQIFFVSVGSKMPIAPNYRIGSGNSLLLAEVEDHWRTDVELYEPLHEEQILLPDNAMCLATKAFLALNQLPYERCERTNAEQMLPADCDLPLLRYGPSQLKCGFTEIVHFINSKKIGSISSLNEADRIDMRTYVCNINTNLLHAELYFTWLHQATFEKVTLPRFGYGLPWPLDQYLTFAKRYKVRSDLKATPIHKLTVDQIYTNFEEMLKALSTKLGTNEFFYETFTELDALVYGHLHAIITTPLPNKLSLIAKKFENLIALTKRIDKICFKDKSVKK